MLLSPQKKQGRQKQQQPKHHLNPPTNPTKSCCSFFVPHKSIRPSILYLLLLLLLLTQKNTLTTATSSSSSTNYNPYKILEVPPNATQDSIRKNYKRLCLKYHPDKNIQKSNKERLKCEETFKLIQKAHSDIGNEESRVKYDNLEMMKKRYGDTASRAYSSDSSGLGRSMEEEAEAFFQSFFGDYGGSSRRSYHSSSSFFGGNAPKRRTRFYFNGVDISNYFPGVQGNGGGFNSPFFNAFATSPPSSSSSFHNLSKQEQYKNQPKSIYIQKVSIPLATLYTGTQPSHSTHEFKLKETIYTRYKAAIRGGIVKPIALRGLLTSLSTVLFLRTKPIVSALFFVLYVHMNLPRPAQLFYESKIERGWKDGTKLTFQNVNMDRYNDIHFGGGVGSMDNGGTLGGTVDVMFILKEEQHDRYTRHGNDLKTTVTIGITKAQKGCTLFIDPLSNVEMPIMITLKPGEAFQKMKKEEQKRRSRQQQQGREKDVVDYKKRGGVFTIKIKGRGWPKRNLKSSSKHGNTRRKRSHVGHDTMEKGDLIVEIKVVSDEQAQKLKRKKKRRESSSSSKSSSR